jgi:CheY-like chemotaxis protein
LPGGGRVTVSTRRGRSEDGSEQLEVEVADTGMGMDEDTRRRCMEPFFTTKGERGSGLGLAMVFGCVQRHDAAMDIDSAPGQGTRVRLRFPVAQEAVTDAASGLLLAEDEGPSRVLRVLLIDDDPLLLESVGEVLAQAGHQVTRAEGGAIGLKTFEAALADQGFDAVITDLGMPGVDGRQVARRVRELAPATPVIMLTGWGRRMEEEADMPDGVDLLLSKPPRRHQLLGALQRLSAAGPRPAP